VLLLPASGGAEAKVPRDKGSGTMRGWRRAAEVVKAFGLCTGALVILTACATTEYKVWEARTNVLEGSGGTKLMYGMELWDNGEPPRKFTVLGIIDDARPAGPIPMARLRGDMVRRAREAGGDALIQLNSQSHIAGTYMMGSGTGYAFGSMAMAQGSSVAVPVRRNVAKFAVIKYLD
jgi:hypothetical protein